MNPDQFHIESGLINVAGKTAQSEDLYCVVVVYYLLVRSVLPTSSIPPTSNVAERATVPVLIHRSLLMVASRAMDKVRFPPCTYGFTADESRIDLGSIKVSGMRVTSLAHTSTSTD